MKYPSTPRITVTGLLFALAFLCQPTLAQDRWVDKEESIRQLTIHQKALDRMIKELYQTYQQNSHIQLGVEMDKLGVVGARDNLQAWSGWLTVDAQDIARNFHHRHAGFLKESVQVALYNKGLPESDLAYLDRGMKRLENLHGAFMGSMQKKVGFAALRGQLIDKLNSAVGTSEIKRLEALNRKRVADQEVHDKLLWTLVKRTAFSSLKETDRVPVALAGQSERQKGEVLEIGSASYQAHRTTSRLAFSGNPDGELIKVDVKGDSMSLNYDEARVLLKAFRELGATLGELEQYESRTEKVAEKNGRSLEVYSSNGPEGSMIGISLTRGEKSNNIVLIGYQEAEATASRKLMQDLENYLDKA